MAAMWAKGELPLNQDFNHEGILSTIFTGRLIRETTVGDVKRRLAELGIPVRPPSSDLAAAAGL